MRSRIVILSALAPRGEHGLAADVRAAEALGVTAVPIPTAMVLQHGKTRRVVPQPVRILRSMLQEALEEPADGMLLGLLPRNRLAQVVARVLCTVLPETIIFSPLPLWFDARPELGRLNRRTQLHRLVPDATVVVLPAPQIDLFAASNGAGSDAALVAANQIRQAGAQAAWIIGNGYYGRGLDVIAHARGGGTLSYPPPLESSAPHALPAALAALLARGFSLDESIDRAHRYSRGFEQGLQLSS